MTLNPTPNLRIEIEKPAEALAETMNAIRSWLDHSKIEPAEFKTEPAGHAIAIKVRFRSEHEAELFAREFASVQTPERLRRKRSSKLLAWSASS